MKKRIILGVSAMLILSVFGMMFASCGNVKETAETKATVSDTAKDTDKAKSANKYDSAAEKATVSPRSGSSAKKGKYTVIFKDEDGKVLSEQKIKCGTAAKAPEAPAKKGYYFYSWSKGFDKVTNDLKITPIYFKNGSTPKISLNKVTAKKGDKNVAVTVSLKNNPGIASAAMDVIYDKSRLRLTNFSYNTDSLKGASTVPFSADADPACLSMVNGSENITGDFDFATLYFDVLENAEGSYPITITYDSDDVYNIDEKNITFTPENGLITVK